MHDSIIQEIKPCLKLDGDFLYFRPFKGDDVIKIVKSIDVDKKIWLIHNSLGLENPTDHDKEKDGKILYTQGRFCNLRKNLLSKLQSNLGRKLKNYEILDYKSTQLSLSKLTSKHFCIVILDTIQYQPTLDCLKFFTKYLIKNGKIIVTNYNDNSDNLCSKAVKMFLKNNQDKFIIKINKLQKCIILERTLDLCEVIDDQLTENIQKLSDNFYINNNENKNNEEIIISCVLKTGGVYDYNYVNALANAVKQNVTVNHKLICITNDSSNFNSNIDDVILFKNNFPKWWGKIELFRPDIFNNKRIFFLDLDTVILKNIDHLLVEKYKFMGLRDFYRPTEMGSGLLFWEHDHYHHIYEKFLKNSTYIINNTPEGDQRWIADNVGKINYFQDHFKTVFSYKKHCLPGNKLKIPKDASIICFHGKPKPHEITNELKNYWKP
jgi:hypothetical protein